MKKVTIFSILVTLVFLISSFTEKEKTTNNSLIFTNEISTALTEAEATSIQQNIQIPFVGNEFNGFKEAVAFKESQGRYHIVNTLGYLGKYQFGRATLERFRIYNTSHFLKTPELQEDAFIALCSLNKWILRKDIKRSVGKKINGVVITESGILAAAHLAGAGNVKKYLRSYGANSFEDAYGASVYYYMKKFAGYNTSIIEANRKPVV
ncbi:peptidoglycan-binding protein LysM [Lutibacter sp. TH_r2]|uniref:peptidoglycan-binding protein LysM n=1 Tax=Lutibacter sp. TH_r2 TaxID=3082083 RepID=UPI002955CAD7|nr:peptidoglycan-binding protein LysM [Lutibacter sp. TH_r2]MDV7188514.1 peptidoglycan-binding protein LysM [Lutibacter sp. TH_r2]